MRRPLPTTSSDAPGAASAPDGGTSAVPGAADLRWCRRCGIPHAPEARYCSHCGMPLDEDSPAAMPAATRPAAIPRAETPAPMPAPPDANPPGDEQPRPAGALNRRARRSRPLSDDEVEAAAAAIVSQARLLPEPDGTGTALPPLPDDDAQALRMSGRDRRWLAAGVVCCVLLLLLAVAFVRFLSVAPVAR